MLLSILLVVLGIGLLVGGGEVLLRGAVGLASLWKLTPAVIGLTVVAAGTSVPELAVSAVAAVTEKPDIAVGNVIGSNIFNITVIVGLCAVIRAVPIVGNTIKLEYPVLALATLLCVVLVHDGQISRLEAFFFVSCYAGFTAYMVQLVRKQATSEEQRELQEEVRELAVEKQPHLLTCLALTAAGVVLLGAGAQSTVAGAAQLARILGWSERLIGLTIVSIGTGLPEVVASLVSTIRGRSDIALGNVIGSNLFNILAILGISGLMSPLPVSAELIHSDCWWMLGLTAFLFPLMYSGKRLTRGEGMLLLGAYAVYLSLLIRSE